MYILWDEGEEVCLRPPGGFLDHTRFEPGTVSYTSYSQSYSSHLYLPEWFLAANVKPLVSAGAPAAICKVKPLSLKSCYSESSPKPWLLSLNGDVVQHV